ncbi:hypothetical protein K469DRAFT_713000 [Zopfia rhizophila CBS 207.26]|uniref:Uncharacterized protein n=1 Tax=Zopfia rhizophila CBS 207.26 TaxID=1314779 RepID=A0A6A6DVD0_9PEZI|nr:hypothetical protein K469DRAFT_713000 [Zopfia rhizophila CBS 207.26]
MPFPLLFIAIVSLFQFSIAGVAPEITTVQEGYNIIAKLPCLGCPFLVQDTSRGENESWTVRTDDNALLLNITLPYDSSYIELNGQRVWPAYSKLQKIYANQVVQDISDENLQAIISTGQLESSHETYSGGGYFGLSYSQSLRHIRNASAFIFQLDIIEIWSDLPPTPILHKLENPNQKMLELLLLQKPVMSALEPISSEIIKAELVSRGHHGKAQNKDQQVMHFLEWDSFGQKGTLTHYLSSWGSAMLNFLDSGIWALLAVIFGILLLFVLVCVICIFGCDFWQDDYSQAQHGKARGQRRRVRGDVEQGKVGFKSAEELGLLGRGRVVGLGKSD